MSLLAAFAVLSLLATQPGGPATNAPATNAEEPPPSAAPSTIDDLLQQPPMDEDAREAAVRAAYDAAQARRGGLDGRWRLTARDGHALYIFQFSDPGQMADPRSSNPHVPVIEGAWRDPRRQGEPESSGFLASVQRDGGALVVRFDDRDGAHPRIVTLHARGTGEWAGALEADAGSQPVVMTRF